MSTCCASIREHLGAYVDGELNSADRLRVAAHLVDCEACREALEGIRELGALLRAHSICAPEPADLAGLAAGVISRTRAEQSQSWRSLLQRGLEDWHWAMIGAGSLAAAVVSVLVAAAICVLGPQPAREDSLAALINNLQAPAGKLLMIATPVGRDQVPMLMEFNRGEAVAVEDDEPPAVLPAGFAGPNGNDLALALAQAVVGPDGRMSDFRSMSPRDRMQAESLMQEIQRLRAVPLTTWSGRRLNIQKLIWSTRTQVTGKTL